MTYIDDTVAPLPAAIVELVADPEAQRWARDCAWVPGTGHCGNRPCSLACVFHHQRLAEARRILRWRSKRRAIQPGFSGRMGRSLRA